MKKLINFILVITLIINATTTIYAETSNNWADKYVIYICKSNLIKDEYKHNLNYKMKISKLDSLDALYKFAEKNKISYSDDILRLNTKNNFENITREEFMVIVSKIIFSDEELKNIDSVKLPFKDINKVSGLSLKKLEALYINGIINGDDEGYLNPHNYLTMEQMAKILYLSNEYLDMNIYNKNTQQDINYLWNHTINNYLLDELWTDINIYDAGHHLMIPMIAAFKLNNREWKEQFKEQFKRFCKAYYEDKVDLKRLNFLHYLNLCSQYLSLCTDREEYDLIPDGLEEIVFDNLYRIWNEEAWQWDREPFSNMKERINWKLSVKEVKYSYLPVIIDEETFCFSIAANLRNTKTVVNSINNKNTIEEILNIAYNVFKDRSIFTGDGGYLFQPGLWTDHPEFMYSGNLEKKDYMEKKKVEYISPDTSHSHRLPSLLYNLKNAYGYNTDEFKFYNKILQSFANQFSGKILISPTNDFLGYRTTNYIDGYNGIYNWNSSTQGTNNGYGPYELSGTFMLGWWSLLESEAITEAYKFMSKAFPLNENVINTYVGPNTTRIRNKYVELPNFYTNGFAELICKLIAEMYK